MLILIASQSAFAFDQRIDTVVLNYDTVQVLQVIVTVDNTDSEALWIWTDNHDYGKDYRTAIKSHMKKRRGDFSIYDIATDPNMFGEWWHPNAPKDSFVKYLEPGKTFTIIFYKEIISTPEYRDGKNITNDIKVFSNQQMKEICPGIEETYCVKRISYPHNIIAFQINNK